MSTKSLHKYLKILPREYETRLKFWSHTGSHGITKFSQHIWCWLCFLQFPESASYSIATWNLPPNVSAQFLLIHLINVHLPHSQLNHSMQTRMTRKLEKGESIHYLPRDPVVLSTFQIQKRQMVFFPKSL